MKDYPVNDCTTTEKRRTQVREQMDVIQAASASTRDSLEQLLHRLEPVLRQDPVCKIGEEVIQSELVPVASELREMHGIAAGNNSIVIDILERLEL